MKSKVIWCGPWQLNPTGLVSGLVHEDKEVVLKSVHFVDNEVDKRCFPLCFLEYLLS